MPLAIDLFCGLGGWTEGLLAEGFEVVGFDIERHRYPARALPDGDRKVGIDGVPNALPRQSSKSPARKAASAMVAKIPLPLARWIARAWLPR